MLRAIIDCEAEYLKMMLDTDSTVLVRIYHKRTPPRDGSRDNTESNCYLLSDSAIISDFKA